MESFPAGVLVQLDGSRRGQGGDEDQDGEDSEVEDVTAQSVAEGQEQKRTMVVWGKVCRVIRTVASVLEDEETQQRIAEGLSALTGEYQGRRGVDLQEVTREFFDRYLNQDSKTFSVFQATHQSILTPALIYLRKNVLSEQV